MFDLLQKMFIKVNIRYFLLYPLFIALHQATLCKENIYSYWKGSKQIHFSLVFIKYVVPTKRWWKEWMKEAQLEEIMDMVYKYGGETNFLRAHLE